MGYLIYGKRTGFKVEGEERWDKTFRALDYKGVRVNRLTDAGEYATKEDAEEVLAHPVIQQRIKDGLIEFDIRKV